MDVDGNACGGGESLPIRDRIIELRRVRADTLRPNPRNWRTHPPAQRAALRGVLQQVGYAGALLARALPDGSLELLDGHLRAETTPDAEVPVLLLDLDDSEAALLLSVHDPLAAMAGSDAQRLAELASSFEAQDAAVRRLIQRTLAASGAAQQAALAAPEVVIPESYQVIVHCGDEDDQRQVFEEMSQRGYRCRVLCL